VPGAPWCGHHQAAVTAHAGWLMCTCTRSLLAARHEPAGCALAAAAGHMRAESLDAPGSGGAGAELTWARAWELLMAVPKMALA
jgi:hypothetical protein